MQAKLTLVFILTSICVPSLCSVLAYKGYMLSSPNVRGFLIRTGFGSLLTRKSQAFYEASNFRYASDQGTEIRKAEMDSYDILELDPESNHPTGPVHNYSKEEDRVYSEKLFSTLNEMDRNSCISRLLCEIGADPKPFGLVGMKIHHYLKSVPPVTWNSATFPYMEAFRGGLVNSNTCYQHYKTCNYDLRRVMSYLWMFLKPIN